MCIAFVVVVVVVGWVLGLEDVVKRGEWMLFCRWCCLFNTC